MRKPDLFPGKLTEMQARTYRFHGSEFRVTTQRCTKIQNTNRWRNRGFYTIDDFRQQIADHKPLCAGQLRVLPCFPDRTFKIEFHLMANALTSQQKQPRTGKQREGEKVSVFDQLRSGWFAAREQLRLHLY